MQDVEITDTRPEDGRLGGEASTGATWAGVDEVERPLVSPRLALLFFGLTAGLMSADVFVDLVVHGADLLHVALEAVLSAVSITGAIYFARLARRERGTRLALAAALVRSEAERARLGEQAARWRSEARSALDGLSQAIDLQFERWGLTAAEREVALLLLKGLSHKEAADVRGTSERTVRQQALTVYKKAEVSGRAELSAFFLEDLMSPSRVDRDRRPGGG